MSRNWLLYLDDIIESAEKIQRFVGGRTYENFRCDEATFDAVLFNLQIIGESAKKLPESLRTDYPTFDWSAPARLRDLIAHHYFAIDAEIIWEVATMHVPTLLAEARTLRKSVEGRQPY